MSTYIIAEAGVNHDGNLDRALELVDIAKGAGADCVKFQVFNAKTCKGTYKEILEPLELPYAAFEKIKIHCDDAGIDFLASCFDCAAVDFVVSLGLDTVKIGSGELTNHRLIEHVAKSNLKMILSTGMSTLDEISEANKAFAFAGGGHPALLHCVSNYPTRIRHCNLRAITTLKKAFGCLVGFSDHTKASWSAIAAIALGAEILEKHFTYDDHAKGPDHHMSLMPGELAQYVQAVRSTERMLGTGEKILQPGEDKMRSIIRGRWDG